MDNVIKSRLNKKDILTIPNLLSVVRLLLIPVIVVLYCVHKKYIASVAIIALSGITDIVDGFIARKFNMISDFGKVLDPVADKLTQAAMIMCLISRYSDMMVLIVLMVLKETLLAVLGLVALKTTNTVNSAKWYGKVSTATIYTVMIFLFLSVGITGTEARILIAICGVVLFGSMLLYGRFYYRIFKAENVIKNHRTTVHRAVTFLGVIDFIAIIGLIIYYI